MGVESGCRQGEKGGWGSEGIERMERASVCVCERGVEGKEGGQWMGNR